MTHTGNYAVCVIGLGAMGMGARARASAPD